MPSRGPEPAQKNGHSIPPRRKKPRSFLANSQFQRARPFPGGKRAHREWQMRCYISMGRDAAFCLHCNVKSLPLGFRRDVLALWCSGVSDGSKSAPTVGSGVLQFKVEQFANLVVLLEVKNNGPTQKGSILTSIPCFALYSLNSNMNSSCLRRCSS